MKIVSETIGSKLVQRPDFKDSDMTGIIADISINSDWRAEWKAPGIFSRPLMLVAAAVLCVAGIIAGVFSILYAKNIISVTVKDCLVGSYIFIMYGSALLLSGKLDRKRAAALTLSVIAFQAWNTLFFHTPHLAVFVIVLGLWLPFYWLWTDPESMKEIGLVKTGIAMNLLAGIAMSAAFVSYIAWGMANFGFSFEIEIWRLIVNSAQVLPMFLAIFAFFFMVWEKLRLTGLSSMSMLVALVILSASLNAPNFILFGAASDTPFVITLAGFTAITVIMALTTSVVFSTFRSALPAACLFTAMSALLFMAGLV
ncbi:MAG TPA: hypothetical protein PKH33_09115 [bacterium]|nr:hypothetical protein [bacterium]